MRARNLKPGFFTNDILAECEVFARLLYAGLWGYSDREGRFEWRPKKIKAAIFPYDDVDIENLLEQLRAKEFILQYSINGNFYGWVPNFLNHQHPHYNEAKSKLPECTKQNVVQYQHPDISKTCLGKDQDISKTTPADSLNPDSLNPDSLNKNQKTELYTNSDIDTEADKTEEKEKPSADPPPRSRRYDSLLPKDIVKEIDDLCSRIRIPLKTFSARAYTQQLLERKNLQLHPIGLLRTIEAVVTYQDAIMEGLEKGTIGNAYQYVEGIFKRHNQHANEQDAIRNHKKVKKEVAEWVDKIFKAGQEDRGG